MVFHHYESPCVLLADHYLEITYHKEYIDKNYPQCESISAFQDLDFLKCLIADVALESIFTYGIHHMCFSSRMCSHMFL